VHWFYAPIAHHAAHTPCLPAAPTSPGRTLSGRPSLLSPGDRFSPPPIFAPPHGGNFLGSTASEAQAFNDFDMAREAAAAAAAARAADRADRARSNAAEAAGEHSGGPLLAGTSSPLMPLPTAVLPPIVEQPSPAASGTMEPNAPPAAAP
jgi:hypothetical protein